MAAAGALLVSSGIALMAAPSPASGDNGVHKSYVCKYVGKPGVGEVAQAGGNPIFVDNHSIAGKDVVSVGDLFADAHDFSIVVIANTERLDPEPSASICDFATATVTPIQADCDNGNVASYTKAGTKVAGWSESAAPLPGTTITVTATAESPAVFSSGLTTKAMELTFDPAETNCTNVSPPTTPQVSPPKAKTDVKAEAEAETPTVVHAGLAGATDTSTEAGLGLTAAGLLLMTGAGGAVLVGAERRTNA